MKPRAEASAPRYPMGTALRYGVAASIGVVSLILGVVLPIHGAFKLLLFTSYMLLVLISSALGGFWPGLLCTLLCAVGIAYWLEPQGSIAVDAPAEIFGTLAFIVAGALVSGISERMHRAMRLEMSARHLAEETAEAERRAREAAQEAAGALRVEQRAREELLALVAHDLQDPLGVIDLGAGIIERITAGNEQVQRRAEVLHRTAQRMSRLIRDLLASSALALDELSIDREPESVAALLAQTVEEHEPQALARSIGLGCEVPPELPRVACDRDRVLQVLSNLVANAVRFTPAGGRVTLRAEALDGFVRVGVGDTGRGISAELLPHVFEPYSRERRTQGGRTGLGLSIAKAVIERHGGTIGVESRTGEGTTFTFTLPIAAPQPAEASAQRIERAADGVGAGLRAG